MKHIVKRGESPQEGSRQGCEVWYLAPEVVVEWREV